MILIDSSVWIDRLRDHDTRQTRALKSLIIAQQDIGVGDLMLIEVLQGTRDLRAYGLAKTHLAEFPHVQISDHVIAEAAARNFQTLRARGITVRKTINTLIATRCILDDIPLLYSDRDFDPFVAHLGLRSVMDEHSGVN